MSRSHFVIIATVFVAGSYIPLLHGDSIRCGRKIVRTGDSSGELLRICGKPYHKDRGRAEIDVNGIPKSVGVERWYYKKSSRSLEHIVVIYRGNVEQVVVSGR